MEVVIITDKDIETAEHVAEILTDLIKNIKKAVELLAEALIELVEHIAKAFGDVIDIIRHLYREVRRTAPNNWLKLHGLPMRRRGYISRSAL